MSHKREDIKKALEEAGCEANAAGFLSAKVLKVLKKKKLKLKDVDFPEIIKVQLAAHPDWDKTRLFLKAEIDPELLVKAPKIQVEAKPKKSPESEPQIKNTPVQETKPESESAPAPLKHPHVLDRQSSGRNGAIQSADPHKIKVEIDIKNLFNALTEYVQQGGELNRLRDPDVILRTEFFEATVRQINRALRTNATTSLNDIPRIRELSKSIVSQVPDLDTLLFMSGIARWDSTENQLVPVVPAPALLG